MDGIARIQVEGGPIHTLTAGMSARIEPDENHWHGATLGSFMSHIAIEDSDQDGADTHWGRLVTDEEYGA